jgi:hypothetical protein
LMQKPALSLEARVFCFLVGFWSLLTF